MQKYEIDTFHVPPENQGQIVEVAYGMDPYSQVIVVRTIDRSTGETSYVAYDGAECERFEPWNEAPELGAPFGECEIQS